MTNKTVFTRSRAAPYRRPYRICPSLWLRFTGAGTGALDRHGGRTTPHRVVNTVFIYGCSARAGSRTWGVHKRPAPEKQAFHEAHTRHPQASLQDAISHSGIAGVEELSRKLAIEDFLRVGDGFQEFRQVDPGIDPISWSMLIVSSLAMLPVARGAKGSRPGRRWRCRTYRRRLPGPQAGWRGRLPRVVEVERVADGGEFVAYVIGEPLDFGRVRHAHGVGQADLRTAHVHVFADHPLDVLVGDAPLIRAAEGGDHAAPELEPRIQRHTGHLRGRRRAFPPGSRGCSSG